MDVSRYREFKDQYANIPRHTQHALTYYITDGYNVGSFLSAVLANDLQKAIAHADNEHLRELRNIVQWIYNVAPQDCWGSNEKSMAWHKQRGLMGLLCPA